MYFKMNGVGYCVIYNNVLIYLVSMSSSNEISTKQLNDENDVFNQNKRRYFVSVGLGQIAAMRMHKDAGLLEKNSDSERPWGNVTEHCLVEAARADVLSELLKLPEDLSSDFKKAAALHDYFKKGETEIVAQYEYSWVGFEKASEISELQMKKRWV